MVSKWQRHLNHLCFLKLLKSYERISTENVFSKPEFFLSSYRKPHRNFLMARKGTFRNNREVLGTKISRLFVQIFSEDQLLPVEFNSAWIHLWTKDRKIHGPCVNACPASAENSRFLFHGRLHITPYKKTYKNVFYFIPEQSKPFIIS